MVALQSDYMDTLKKHNAFLHIVQINIKIHGVTREPGLQYNQMFSTWRCCAFDGKFTPTRSLYQTVSKGTENSRSYRIGLKWTWTSHLAGSINNPFRWENIFTAGARAHILIFANLKALFSISSHIALKTMWYNECKLSLSERSQRLFLGNQTKPNVVSPNCTRMSKRQEEDIL